MRDHQICLPHPDVAPWSFRRLLRAALAVVAGFYRAHRDRHVLARLSDAQLADIGLARGDVDRELAKSLWEPIDWQELERARRRRSWRSRF